MSRITPEAFNVLSRIKRFGLDTWLPGKLVISQLTDSTFTSVNARIIEDLIATGYLSVDSSGAVSTGLAGEHELRSRTTAINESRVMIRDHRFQVITADWALEADATRVRALICSGLAHLGHDDRMRLDRIHLRTREGVEDEALVAIVVSAMSLVTAHYSTGFAQHAHRVGVRAYGEWSEPEAAAA